MRSKVAVNFERRVSISGVGAENCRAETEWADLRCQAPPQLLCALCASTTVTSACMHLQSCYAGVSYDEYHSAPLQAINAVETIGVFIIIYLFFWEKNK